MFAFLLMAIPQTADYTRWYNYLDGGKRGFEATVKRCAEILRPASDMSTSVVFDGPVSRHTDEILGDLDFKAAAFDGKLLSFVLVGSDRQTIDFGVGPSRLVTYDWADDDGRRIVDGRVVDGRVVEIDFSNYRSGFCPGFLMVDEASVDTLDDKLREIAYRLRSIAEEIDGLVGRGD
jgi:hypothetical protein